jgi:hypothetical protein
MQIELLGQLAWPDVARRMRLLSTGWQQGNSYSQRLIDHSVAALHTAD